MITCMTLSSGSPDDMGAPSVRDDLHAGKDRNETQFLELRVFPGKRLLHKMSPSFSQRFNSYTWHAGCPETPVFLDFQ